MEKRHWTTTAFGIVGLGATGSAVWELLKPGVLWAGSGALAVATLGTQTLRNGLYEDAASRTGWPSGGVAVINIVSLTIVMASAVLLLALRQPPRTRTQLLAMPALIGLAAGIFITGIRENYVVGLLRYRTSLEVQATAFAPPQRIAALNALYVRGKTREDYIRNVRELEAIVRSGGLTVPARDFF